MDLTMISPEMAELYHRVWDEADYVVPPAGQKWQLSSKLIRSAQRFNWRPPTVLVVASLPPPSTLSQTHLNPSFNVSMFFSFSIISVRTSDLVTSVVQSGNCYCYLLTRERSLLCDNKRGDHSKPDLGPLPRGPRVCPWVCLSRHW